MPDSPTHPDFTPEQLLGKRNPPPAAKKKRGRAAKAAAPAAPVMKTLIIPELTPRTKFPEPTSIIPGITWEVVPVKRKEEKGEGWHNHTLIITLPDRRNFKFAQEKPTDASMLHDAVLALKVRLDAEAEAKAAKALAKAEADSRRS